jgi:hypothetical protein
MTAAELACARVVGPCAAHAAADRFIAEGRRVPCRNAFNAQWRFSMTCFEEHPPPPAKMGTCNVA